MDSSRPASSPLLEPAEQQMLKLITQRREQGASLSEILGDMELTSGADRPVFRLAPAVEAEAKPTVLPGDPPAAQFVPYEPYPGCVSHLSPPPAGSTPSRQAAAAAPPSTSDVTSDVTGAELSRLRREKAELEERLGVSQEVTDELKRLLVASIGEDIESRLHLLTEDRAQLGRLVRTFSAQAAAQVEGRDQLAIQCDVWRSKFMACSLMVDELAGWKAVLSRRCRETEMALRSLTAERRQVADQLDSAVRNLSSLRDAFDPAAARAEAPGDLHTLQLAGRAAELSGALRHRLLATPPPPPQSVAEGAADRRPLSPAEAAADKALSAMAQYKFSALPEACKDRGMLDRFHPQARLEHLTVTCCQHCSGEIHVV